MCAWTALGRTAALTGVCLVGLLWSADRAAAADFNHVRSEDAFVRDLLRAGYQRSSTFKALVDEIESGQVIVYIERVAKLSREMEGALLHTAAGSSEIRFLRVVIKTSLAGDYAIGVLAHELQHVAEVLRAGATDRNSIANVFAAPDADLPADAKFETPEARSIAERVVRELKSNARR